MDPVKKLTHYFEHFPGIGPRQAKRFVYHLLKSSPETLRDLANSLTALQRHIRTCTGCYRFYEAKASNGTLCAICADNARDATTLMVVAKDIDLENIERSSVFRGHYFVLGNTIPILEKSPERKILIKELLNRTLALQKSGLQEVVIALNSTPEGDHTSEYLIERLKPLTDGGKLKISLLGKGLSTGLELEYSDSDTIKHAVKNRFQP